MTDYFLDSSAQAVRLFYHHSEKERLAELLDSAEKVYTTRYARYEFYHTWFLDGLKLFAIAMESSNLGEIHQKLSITREQSSVPRILQLLGHLLLQQPEETHPKMIAARIRMLIEDELDFLFTFLKPGKFIEELDELQCTMLNLFENHQWFSDFQGEVFPDLPANLQCSRDRAQCQIVQFVKARKPNFAQVLAAHEQDQAGNADPAFVRYGKIVLDEPGKAKGRNCSYLSDWLMIAHCPADTTLISMDKHWQLMCQSENRPFIKLNIRPEFDKQQIRTRMSPNKI